MRGVVGPRDFNFNVAVALAKRVKVLDVAPLCAPQLTAVPLLWISAIALAAAVAGLAAFRRRDVG